MTILKDYFMTEGVPMNEYYLDWLYEGEEMIEQREELDAAGKSKGYIPGNRNFLLALGSNTSLLLAELCDKQDFYKKTKQLNSLGEFFYTIIDCEVNTGLSRKQQIVCIDKLEKRGFIEYTITRDMPMRRFFKMAEDEVIIKALGQLCIEADAKRSKILKLNNESKEHLQAELDKKFNKNK